MVFPGFFCFQGVPCDGEEPEGAGAAVSKSLNGIYGGIKDTSTKALIATLEKSGKAGQKIFAALQSAVEFGLIETADNAERVEGLFRHTLPRHTAKWKDSTFTTTDALGNYATNNYQRVMSGLGEVVKVADEVSDTTLDESKKIINSHGNILKTGIKLIGTVSNKADEYAKKAMDKTADIVNDPKGHLTPVLASLNPYSWYNSWYGSSPSS
uniref:Uncharacterized protein n=1 Tax=Cacopsylla melanoneura TaxID=428564 RepID=A0A8D9F6I2_9HEMI